MPSTPVIIHERRGVWARQLRSRLRSWPIQWWETRSAGDLVEAVRPSSWPILVVDLEDRAARMLEDLEAATRVAPASLSLVLNPRSIAEIPQLAREIGATLVIDGPLVPPRVEALLLRWLPLSRKRAEAEGWSQARAPEPQNWEIPSLLAR